MLFSKQNKVFALIINTRVEKYPGSWTQIHMLVLTSLNELREISHEQGVFYDYWLKVLT